jgi:GntR family carbon starvation induced transcriptional regulator
MSVISQNFEIAIVSPSGRSYHPVLMTMLNNPSSAAQTSRTLAGYAFERLRDDLKANCFQPGARLRFEDMRARYDVGVAPLREALSRLAETGMVVQIGQKGFRAATASLEDLADVIETRRFLEVRALQDALANTGDDWESELVAAFHRFSKVCRRDPRTPAERAVWEEHHTALHRALVGGCRSRWLMQFWSTVFDQAERYRRMAITGGLDAARERDEHERIVQAALARDVKTASGLLHRHIGNSAQRLGDRLGRVLAKPADGKPSANGTSKTSSRQNKKEKSR